MRGVPGKNFPAALGAIALLFVLPAAAQAGEVDDAVLAEVNFARTRPQDYARRLMLQPVSDWERALGSDVQAADPGAFAEAIDFLMRQSPLPPLSRDELLDAAASEHVEAQGPVGDIGHDGQDGERFDARLRRHGLQGRMAAENIAYGPSRASDVVRELIIDSGVASRGHRRNIFHPDLAAAGVACGSHRDYVAMCVMDFAGPAPEAPDLEAESWRQAALSAPAFRRPQGLLARLLSLL
jgi:uncharacterized protein YkwD